MDTLAAILRNFLIPDNAQRQQAEEAFRQLAKDPGVVPALLQFVRQAQEEEVRQLAAVLLRKKIGGLWTKLGADTQAAVKASLLEGIAADSSPLVRRGCADVVSVIAKHCVPRGEWQELLPFLLQCCQSPQDSHREVAFVLFTSLAETISEQLRPHLSHVHPVLAASLQDQRPGGVRIAALRAVGAMVEHLEAEQDVLFLRELVPPVIVAGRLAVANGEEEAAVRVCEILDELAESPAPVLGPHLPAVVAFALEVACNRTLDPNTRFQAAQVLAWLASWKAKALSKHKAVQPVVAAMLPLLAEPVGETDSEDDDTYDLSAQRFASQVLDALAINGPSKSVFVQVVAFAKAHISSPDHQQRFAAVMSVAVITEGCCEQVAKRMEPDVLPLLLAGLRDPHSKVRGAACFAVGQLAEYASAAEDSAAGGSITEHYKAIVSAVLAVTEDPAKDVQMKAYYALAAYCEQLEEAQILEFLEPLMTKLMGALRCGGASNLREMSLSAIGSAAVAASDKFLPYVQPVLEMLVPLVTATAESELEVRAHAYDLVGVIGVAVGRPAVESMLPGFIDAALKGFSLDHCELREYAHSFFADVAKLLENDFQPYLPHVVPLAFASCRLNDGLIVREDDADKPEGQGKLPAKGDADDDDDDDDEDDDDLGRYSVRTAVLDEKAAAAQALGAYAEYTGAAFAPYLEQSLVVLLESLEYAHEDVRQQGLQALKHVVLAADKASPPRTPAEPASPETAALLGKVMEAYTEIISTDDDKQTVTHAFESVTGIVQGIIERRKKALAAAGQPEASAAVAAAALAAALIQPYVQRLCESVQKTLRGQLTCQEEEDDGDDGEGAGHHAAAADDEEDDDSESERDTALADSVMELTGALSSALRAEFAPLFRELLPDVLTFTKASHPASHRSAAVGCIAEVLDNTAQALAPVLDVDALVPLLVRELRFDDVRNRRNAAFCSGKLCETAGPNMQRHYNALLLALHPLFRAEEDADVRDNAASAVARMIVAGGAALPLNQVLPVFVEALPLTSDLDEAPCVYSCVCALLSSHHAEILPLVPQLVPKLATVLAAKPDADGGRVVSDEVKRTIGQTFVSLRQAFPAQMQPLLEALPVDVAPAVAHFMS